jgi:Na+-transporting NADH:ubiquinone oxidoreductase subunit C
MQLANLEAERAARLETMLSALPAVADIVRDVGADTLETRLVDLETGRFAAGVDLAGYDQRAAAADPDLSNALPPEVDVARISRRPNLAPVHLLLRNDEIAFIVLPVSGAGYASTIYAYLALESDLKTVAALTITEHSETPGLGSRIEDEAWLALWTGKKIIDENGDIRIAVVRGSTNGPYEVDGISGATRTTTGITNMLQFWLGDYGYGRFLAGLSAGEVSL